MGLPRMSENIDGVEINLAENLADALAALRYGHDARGHIIGMVFRTSKFLGLGFTSRVRLWTDSDNGGDGRRSALSLAQRLANAGMDARIERPPRGSNPAATQGRLPGARTPLLFALRKNGPLRLREAQSQGAENGLLGEYLTRISECSPKSPRRPHLSRRGSHSGGS